MFRSVEREMASRSCTSAKVSGGFSIVVLVTGSSVIASNVVTSTKKRRTRLEVFAAVDSDDRAAGKNARVSAEIYDDGEDVLEECDPKDERRPRRSRQHEELLQFALVELLLTQSPIETRQSRLFEPDPESPRGRRMEWRLIGTSTTPSAFVELLKIYEAAAKAAEPDRRDETTSPAGRVYTRWPEKNAGQRPVAGVPRRTFDGWLSEFYKRDWLRKRRPGAPSKDGLAFQLGEAGTALLEDPELDLVERHRELTEWWATPKTPS